jgi:hypothetical protein
VHERQLRAGPDRVDRPARRPHRLADRDQRQDVLLLADAQRLAVHDGERERQLDAEARALALRGLDRDRPAERSTFRRTTSMPTPRPELPSSARPSRSPGGRRAPTPDRPPGPGPPWRGPSRSPSRGCARGRARGRRRRSRCRCCRPADRP